MAEWQLTIDVDASPEAVWALLGDLTSPPRWYPKYVGVTVDGSTRTLHAADGRAVVETILEHDADRRRLAYSVVSGAPVASHEASFEVMAHGDGAQIVWNTRAEPQDPTVDLPARLTGPQTDALGRIKTLVEAAAGT